MTVPFALYLFISAKRGLISSSFDTQIHRFALIFRAIALFSDVNLWSI